MEGLSARGIGIINSAVFNAGFLIGGAYFDYELVTPTERPELFEFRRRFLELCHDYSVDPAAACMEFGLSGPGVCAVALNTSKASRVCQNARAVTEKAPAEFWVALKQAGLIRPDYRYV
jgi:D-threo-aldose 1-dehydrogenase